MFNVGGGELLVIMVLALIVLGPTRLPDAARQVGKAMAELRRLSTGFQNEVKNALDVTDTDPVAPRSTAPAPPAPAPAPAEPPRRPARTEPLVAGPGLPPRPTPAPAAPAKPRRPSAQERAAARKQAGATAPEPKNGTPAKKATASKGGNAAARRTKT